MLLQYNAKTLWLLGRGLSRFVCQRIDVITEDKQPWFQPTKAIFSDLHACSTITNQQHSVVYVSTDIKPIFEEKKGVLFSNKIYLRYREVLKSLQEDWRFCILEFSQMRPIHKRSPIYYTANFCLKGRLQRIENAFGSKVANLIKHMLSGNVYPLKILLIFIRQFVLPYRDKHIRGIFSLFINSSLRSVTVEGSNVFAGPLQLLTLSIIRIKPWGVTLIWKLCSRNSCDAVCLIFLKSFSHRLTFRAVTC